MPGGSAVAGSSRRSTSKSWTLSWDWLSLQAAAPTARPQVAEHSPASWQCGPAQKSAPHESPLRSSVVHSSSSSAVERLQDGGLHCRAGAGTRRAACGVDARVQ